jgi:hypothetical protein
MLDEKNACDRFLLQRLHARGSRRALWRPVPETLDAVVTPEQFSFSQGCSLS